MLVAAREEARLACFVSAMADAPLDRAQFGAANQDESPEVLEAW
jgi:hypothetical protein